MTIKHHNGKNEKQRKDLKEISGSDREGKGGQGHPTVEEMKVRKEKESQNSQLHNFFQVRNTLKKGQML